MQILDKEAQVIPVCSVLLSVSEKYKYKITKMQKHQKHKKKKIQIHIKKIKAIPMCHCRPLVKWSNKSRSLRSTQR